MDDKHRVKTIEELRTLYGYPSERAELKVLSALEKHSLNFIHKSPFVLVGTHGGDGSMDVSPRGGSPGFVHVLSDKELILPDFSGNNRVDTLSNIVETGKVGLIFLVPGIDETLRINGSAHVSTNTKYIDLFNGERKPPKAVVHIRIEELFLHCAKAFMRSKLWDSASQIQMDDFPTMGQMLKDQMKLEGPAETRDEMKKRYAKDL
jgi:PPOX class probable FMN-dependent enzyme